jgi:hypothetical protein
VTPKAALPDRRRLVRAQARERRARAEIARIRRRAAESKLVLNEEYKEEQLARILATKHAIWRADSQVSSRCIGGTLEQIRAALEKHFAPVVAINWAGKYGRSSGRNNIRTSTVV